MSTAYTTISAGQLRDDWPENYGASGTLAIFATDNFVSDDGKSWVAGTGDSLRNEFVTESAVTVSAGIATYAAFSLPTTDTNTPNNIRYFGVVFDARGGRRNVLFEDRHLRQSLGSSISMLAWANDNAQLPYRPQADTKPTTNEMNVAIAAALYAPATTTQNGLVEISANPIDSAHPVAVAKTDYATTANSGIGKSSVTRSPTSDVTFVEATDYASLNHNGITALSIAPTSASAPKAYGINDTHQPTTSAPVYWLDQFASFAAALTAIGSAVATLVVSTDYSVGNSTVLSTTTLMFLGNGLLNRIGGSTIDIRGPIIAPLSKQIFSGSGVTTFTSNTSISQYSMDWFGVIAGSNDTTVCQAAAAAFPIGAYIKLTPNRTYATKWLSVKQGQTWKIGSAAGSGATIIPITSGGANNELFDIGATTPLDLGGTVWTTKTAMSNATQGATSITVTSSSGFTAGDRVVISAGSFTGSGVEFGPIEYNTVASIPDATHIVVTTPLAYNYSGFGLAGAANLKVYKVPATQPRNVRVFGGTITGGTGLAVYFNIDGTENVEIDHMLFKDVTAQGIMTGGYMSGLNFHDNVSQGSGASTGTILNGASVVNSRFVNNIFNFANGNQTNLEVTWHDNLISGNVIGPVRGVSGIEINKYGFNNTITDNDIWGLDTDVAAGTDTEGIRTYAQGVPANTGNVIVGNRITNIMRPISDRSDNSVISGNTMYNATVHANSVGIFTGSNNGASLLPSANIGVNSITGMNANTGSDLGVPINRMTLGGSTLFEGNGSPENVVTAPIGSLYRRLNGGVNTSLYIKQSNGTGNTGWAAVTP